MVKHLKNFLIQHPYTDKLVINLFNVGDADKFADAFVELSRINEYSDTKFEVRIFIGNVSLIEPGNALKELINPETNISEEAELFSQASENRLFPKLRFSINSIEDFLTTPEEFNAHLSFLVNPFTSKLNSTSSGGKHCLSSQTMNSNTPLILKSLLLFIFISCLKLLN